MEIEVSLWTKVVLMALWIATLFNVELGRANLIRPLKMMQIEIAAAPFFGYDFRKKDILLRKVKTLRWRLRIARIGLVMTIILFLI